MPNYYICFIDWENNEKRLFFEYDETCTIQNMLYYYLRQINHEMTLEKMRITFLYSGKILNDDRYLNKTVRQIFKSKINVSIRVKINESNHIVRREGLLKKFISKFSNLFNFKPNLIRSRF